MKIRTILSKTEDKSYQIELSAHGDDINLYFSNDFLFLENSKNEKLWKCESLEETEHSIQLDPCDILEIRADLEDGFGYIWKVSKLRDIVRIESPVGANIYYYKSVPVYRWEKF